MLRFRPYRPDWLQRLHARRRARRTWTIPRVHRFKVGDLVTRGGDDVQRVLDVGEDGYWLKVECIKAPASGWCKVGDIEEHNLARRYAPIKEAA